MQTKPLKCEVNPPEELTHGLQNMNISSGKYELLEPPAREYESLYNSSVRMAKTPRAYDYDYISQKSEEIHGNKPHYQRQERKYRYSDAEADFNLHSRGLSTGILKLIGNAKILRDTDTSLKRINISIEGLVHLPQDHAVLQGKGMVADTRRETNTLAVLAQVLAVVLDTGIPDTAVLRVALLHHLGGVIDIEKVNVGVLTLQSFKSTQVINHGLILYISLNHMPNDIAGLAEKRLKN